MENNFSRTVVVVFFFCGSGSAFPWQAFNPDLQFDPDSRSFHLSFEMEKAGGQGCNTRRASALRLRGNFFVNADLL